MHIKRQDIRITPIKIMAEDVDIFYYDIFSIKVVDLYKKNPFIEIRARYSKILNIHYDNDTKKACLEEDLNYLIESVLED